MRVSKIGLYSNHSIPLKVVVNRVGDVCWMEGARPLFREELWELKTEMVQSSKGVSR